MMNKVFVLESLLVGSYFPITSKYHVSASVAISLGFPLGFLILSPLTEFLIAFTAGDWKIVQRFYGISILLQVCVFGPLFCEKYADKINLEQPILVETEHRAWTNVYGIRGK